MRKMQKVVLIVMGIFSMILASACGDQDKAAVEKIEQSLKEKYGEEFTVKKIGGGYGTVTTNTLKAIVSPKSAPEKEFDVEITKDLNEVWDKYMNVVMAEKMDEVANEMANSLFGKEVWVKSHFTSRGLLFPDNSLNDKTLNIEDYIKLNPDMDVMLDVFVKSDTAVDIDKQAQLIDQMADELLKEGVKYGGVSAYYVKPDTFNNMKTEYAKAEAGSELGSVIEYFSSDERSFNDSYVFITEYKKDQSLEEIKTNLQRN
ncbi:hypothetical protein [Mesobacillus subterraneus]|uniref:Lipoprotein n=1 Tax=Mesobacillus subterraneus TaxID=285983 RepID=A0A427TRR8_9BACI|nr:hypothetical protein [Mesobacillus subterraneus]RSD27084.1 hypothetical protein EJA10_11105 [Mesobacillus subterraneus]